MIPPVMKRGRRSFSVALVSRSLFVIKLGQDIAQLIRDGQADMRGILKQAQPLVRHIEADDRTPERTARAHHMQIDDR